jgi:GTP-binding protein
VIAAIVGRPNVGKSTLYNRLVGRRQAIVHDQPGVTRDRNYGEITLPDGRALQIVDTGGLVPGDDPWGLAPGVLAAIAESDVVLFVVDGVSGLVAADEIAWEAARRGMRHKPALLVVNKADVRRAREGIAEFYRLDDHPILVSAEHGDGIADLREALQAALPATAARVPTARAEVDPAAPPAVAIIGRPNVGKSSLLNRLVGEERAIVSPVPGTTRDPIDSRVERPEGSFLLIDTAGIRRRSQTSDAPEELAVLMARRQAERADVALLVLDAAQGITSGDLAIAGTLWELGRAAVVVATKWDLVGEEERERFEAAWPRLSDLLAGPRRVNVSSLSGRGVEKIFPAVAATLAATRRTVTTAELNRMLADAVQRHRPAAGRRPWKLFYATQVSSSPPTLMLFVNRGLPRSDPYRRYLEGALRRELDLAGVPIRLVMRAKGGREGER